MANCSAMAPDDKTLVTLIDKLDSKEFAERDAAERELKRLGADSLDRLLPILEQEIKRYRKRLKLDNFLGYGLIFLVFSVPNSNTTASTVFYFLGGCFWFFYLIVLSRLVRTPAARFHQALNAVTAVRSGRTLGKLLEIMDLNSVETNWVITDQLIELLNECKASDYDLLTPAQRLLLYKRMERNAVTALGDRKFALAALKATEQIGDSAALPGVKKIAAHGKTEELQQLAEMLLPFLQDLDREQSTRQTLLRAAHSEAEAQTLLRGIASDTAAKDAEQLLRSMDER